jgi:hypothetical protein
MLILQLTRIADVVGSYGMLTILEVLLLAPVHCSEGPPERAWIRCREEKECFFGVKELGYVIWK